jgi:hypothetical protein
VSDKSILEHITDLVEEEHRLRADAEPPDEKAARLAHIADQLDQCWDLLRQRRAKREFGDDPSTAAVRDARIVKRYEG